MPSVISGTQCDRPGAASATPSMADNTEIAGVMMASP